MNEIRSNAKGERTMSRGFIAQYAAEATMQTEGVQGMAEGGVAAFKSSFGIEHEGLGVTVMFERADEVHCTITVYPIIYFSWIVPEVAWHIQENVKRDIEKYTGVEVDAVNVHVEDIVMQEENLLEKTH